MDNDTKTILGDFNLSADRLANHYCEKHGENDLAAGDEGGTYWCDCRRSFLFIGGRYVISLADMYLDLACDIPPHEYESYYDTIECDPLHDGQRSTYEEWLETQGYNLQPIRE